MGKKVIDLSDKKMLSGVLGRIYKNLNIVIDQKILNNFLNGGDKSFLLYKKGKECKTSLPAIDRYLIGIESYLRHPNIEYFYDIYSPGRMIPMIVCLDYAILALEEGEVKGHKERLRKLVKEKSFDGFESTLYELIVAAKYLKNPQCSNVEFIEETTNPSPDLCAILDNKKYYIECKKPNRENDATTKIKNLIIQKVERIIQTFKRMGKSVIVELRVHCDPHLLDEALILEGALYSYSSCSVEQASDDFSIKVTAIDITKLDSYTLYPSPKYFSEHYQFCSEDDWQGLITDIECSLRSPSWLDEVYWEIAIKWKLTNREVIRKFVKINHKLIFKGLGQLKAKGENKILHFWYEKDRAIGNRRNELVFLMNTIADKNHRFNWIVFNETSSLVSTEGRFDFTEHAHPVTHLLESEGKPYVTNVFIFDGDTVVGGEFGVGVDLPPIDSDDEGWKTR